MPIELSFSKFILVLNQLFGCCKSRCSGFLKASHVMEVYSFLFKMREVRLGAPHTLKSHGVKVVRFHKHDWIMLLGLVVIDVILNIIHPYYRYVGEKMFNGGDLMYPMKSNTVPFWAVPFIGIILPMVIIVGYYFYKRDIYDLHHAILGLLFAVLITGVITDAVKDAVGRPRPDFFWRCFPDGKAQYDPVTRNVRCHGDPKDIREGHKSFPSGHTSWSFAGLGFLSLYLSAKIQIFDRKGHVAKLCIVFLPLLLATLVAISRVDDYWHHWQDVFAGGLLGMSMATFCYRQFFPAPYDSNGVGAYATFQILTATHANEMEAASEWDAQNGTSSQDMQVVALPYFNVEGVQTGASRDIPGTGNGPYLDLERGRRVENIPSEEVIERRGSMGKAGTEGAGRGVTMDRFATERGPYMDRRPSMQ